MRASLSVSRPGAVLLLLALAVPLAGAHKRASARLPAAACADPSAGASAEGLGDAVADFTRYREDILAHLPAAGVSAFAGLSMAKVGSRLKAIQFSAAPWVAVEKDADGMATVRNSAEWWRTGASCYGIRLNMSLWPAELPEVKPALAMHESLGAIGIGDQDYQCSGALWLLSYREALAPVFAAADLSALRFFALGLCRRLDASAGLKAPPRKFASSSPVRHIARSGTSTIVGGGGDGRAIESKLAQLVKLIEELKKAAPVPGATALAAVERILAGSVSYGDPNGIQESPAAYSSPICLYDNGSFCRKLPAAKAGGGGAPPGASHAPCNQMSEALCKAEVANQYQCVVPSPPPHCQEKMLAAETACECPALPEVVAHFPAGAPGETPYLTLMNAFHAASPATIADIPPAGSAEPLHFSSSVGPYTNLKEIFVRFLFDVPGVKIAAATGGTQTLPHYITQGDERPGNLDQTRVELASQIEDERKSDPGDFAEELRTTVRENPLVMIQDSGTCWDMRVFHKVKDLILVEASHHCDTPPVSEVGYAFAWRASKADPAPGSSSP